MAGWLVAGLLVGMAAHGPLRADVSGYDWMNDRGYRAENFSAETPDRHPDATTLDRDGLVRLLEAYDPVLIDVMPRVDPDDERFPHGLPEGTPRVHVPGSDWLPNVGYPELPPELNRRFRRHLEERTDGDQTVPIVIYCVESCWMGWNAARRASRFGYRNVFWFPGGIDEWVREGGPGVIGEPWPELETSTREAI